MGAEEEGDTSGATNTKKLNAESYSGGVDHGMCISLKGEETTNQKSAEKKHKNYNRTHSTRS